MDQCLNLSETNNAKYFEHELNTYIFLINDGSLSFVSLELMVFGPIAK